MESLVLIDHLGPLKDWLFSVECSLMLTPFHVTSIAGVELVPEFSLFVSLNPLLPVKTETSPFLKCSQPLELELQLLP